MRPQLSANDRMMKVLQASPEMQARIDAILEGTDAETTTSAGPLLMGMDQGAQFLGVSRSTLWRIVKSGKIQPIEFRPGSYKLRRQDLERLAGVRK